MSVTEKTFEYALLDGADVSVSKTVTRGLQEIWKKIGRGEIDIHVPPFPGTDKDISKHARQGEIALSFPTNFSKAGDAALLARVLNVSPKEPEVDLSKVSNLSDHFGWRWVYVGEKLPYGTLPYTGLNNDETREALQRDGREGLTLNDALIASCLIKELRGDFLERVWYTRVTESTLDGEPFSLAFDRDGRFRIFRTGPLKGDWLGARYTVPLIYSEPVLTIKPDLHRIK